MLYLKSVERGQITEMRTKHDKQASKNGKQTFKK